MLEGESGVMPEGSGRAGLAAVPPLLASGAVTYMGTQLSWPAGTISTVASAAGIVVAALMLKTTGVSNAEIRVEQPPTRPGGASTSVTVSAPSTRAKVLLIVLAGLSFVLIDQLSNMVGYGSLFYDHQDKIHDFATGADDGHQAFATTLPRSMLVNFTLGIPVAIWFAHRLRSSARVGLYVAIAIDTMLSVFIALALLNGTPFTALDALAFFLGIISWILATFIGRQIAARTQSRFDKSRTI